MNEIETTIDRGAEWKKTLELMAGLFPKWAVTPQQFNSWKEQFGMLNPEWFREALKVVYHRYNSETPKPKWVADAFKEVRAGHRGVPLTESDSAESQRQKAIQERKEEEYQVNLERENAWLVVASWDNEERINWATQFKERFEGIAELNDTANMNTWSKTFAQFVKAFRVVEERNA